MKKKDTRLIFPFSPPFLDFIIICVKIEALKDKRGYNAHYFGLMMKKKLKIFCKMVICSSNQLSFEYKKYANLNELKE
tara:strand:+ start:415 stop:648 length:234 start_codon:yes stop_codon:yes gene_type:complete